MFLLVRPHAPPFLAVFAGERVTEECSSSLPDRMSPGFLLYLQVERVMEECSAFLLDRLSPSSAVATYAMACRHNCGGLRHATLLFTAANLGPVARDTPDDALACLGDDFLHRVLAVWREQEEEEGMCSSRGVTELLGFCGVLHSRGVRLCTRTVERVLACVPLASCSAELLLQLSRQRLARGCPGFQQAVVEEMAQRMDACRGGGRATALDVGPGLGLRYPLQPAKGHVHATCWRISGWSRRRGGGGVRSAPFAIPWMDPGSSWVLTCYPKGILWGAGSHVAVYLMRSTNGGGGGTGSTTAPLKVSFEVVICNQTSPSSCVRSVAELLCTCPTVSSCEGIPGLCPLDKLAEPGFVVDDALVIGLNIRVLSA